MDLTLTEEQELVATTAGELLEARAPAAGARAMQDDPNGFSHELWKEMVELGWTGLPFAEELGGAGATFLDLCLLVEQMGRFQVPSPFVPTVVLCGLPIARFGTREQREAWLGAVARGDRFLSYARAAPGGHWDAPGSEVVATERGESGGFVLDGSASFVPFAHAADGLLVVARREGEGDALTAFLVDVGAGGVTVEAVDAVGHDRPHRVELRGVGVPAEGVLGDVDGGREVVETASAHGTAATCAEMVGGAQAVLDMTVDHAREREQFGRPVGSFQAVQHHCADMAMDVLGSRFAAYEAIWRLSEGLEAGTEVSVAKAWVSEAYRRVCALGHQVHGAIGFTREHDLHLYLRHAVATELSFGDADFHWELVARRLGLTP